MSDAENSVIVEDLASIAVSGPEMGLTDEEIRGQVVGMLVHLRVPEVDSVAVVSGAAAAVSRMPQSEIESADDTERRRHVREMLGMTSADDQLAAMLPARELLEQLA